ncbi:hypothetical protein [Tunturiibacter lichenicola]|uniref:hypothetical protein n=1 Tax=Tunturiibacter lichenicola TaxID=2051959 RepID=UPI003D9AD28D
MPPRTAGFGNRRQDNSASGVPPVTVAHSVAVFHCNQQLGGQDGLGKGHARPPIHAAK